MALTVEVAVSAGVAVSNVTTSLDLAVVSPDERFVRFVMILPYRPPPLPASRQSKMSGFPKHCYGMELYVLCVLMQKLKLQIFLAL